MSRHGASRVLGILTAMALLASFSWTIVPTRAAPPIPVSGTFDYVPTLLETRTADGNTWRYATEVEMWTGDFVGTGFSTFRAEIFSAGFWNVWLRSTFTGTVLGNAGTLDIQLVGLREGGIWNGHWVILSGTGDLAGIRGQGTWSGPGFPGPSPYISYSGQIVD